eukprot:COSAG05_NODE_13527_length_426_cov_2.189602_1_plen_66_part_10
MDVHEFVKSLPSNLEMDFAGQLGWIPQRGHGVYVSRRKKGSSCLPAPFVLSTLALPSLHSGWLRSA